MRKTILLIVAVFATLCANAQLAPALQAELDSNRPAKFESGITANDCVIAGFKSKNSGFDYDYSFPVPGVKHGMLIRATDGTQSMSWETATIPTKIVCDYATFVTPVAIGTGSPLARFTMEVDALDHPIVFTNTKSPNWEVQSSNGVSLSMRSINVDNVGDNRGFLILRVPATILKGREIVNIKISAEKANLSSWMIVYKDAIDTHIDAFLSPTVVNGKQQLVVDVVHFGGTVAAKITINGLATQQKTLDLGSNALVIDIGRVSKPRYCTVNVSLPSGKISKRVRLEPVRNWKVNFVQHSHTDIGYTRSQSEILGEHIRYIDYALDYCDLTDNLPDDARFRWTCETTWAVEQFLKTRPQEQIDRLKRRIKEGRIEVAGMIFNFSELTDEPRLVASLEPLKECRRNGIKVEIAMQNDVNGMAWAYADYYPALGVKYLNMGTHGHRALICFDYPTVFRWQSPSGSEMIAYRAEHYNMGNFLGIENSDFANFELKLQRYLVELQNKGYKWDIASAQFSGYMTDNSPPSIIACDNVRKWNDKYDSPKIRLAVSSEFLKEFEARYGDELPTYRQAWPDWWTDGFGASARETATTRLAQSDMIATQGLLSMAKLRGSVITDAICQQVDEINRSILFYDEHTTGFSESVRDPFCLASMDQRATKESYAWESYRRTQTLNETAKGLLQSYVEKCSKPSIVVYNTLNWCRSGAIKTYIDHQILPTNREFRIIDPTTGREIAAQPLNNRSDGTYWLIWAENVPAMGSAQYIIDVSDKNTTEQPVNQVMPEVVENEWYKIRLSDKGYLIDLFDKQLSKSIVSLDAKWSLGEFVYEQMEERNSLEAFHMGKFSRRTLDKVQFEGWQMGKVYDSYNFSGQTTAGVDEKTKNYTFSLRVYKSVKLVELAYSLVKKSNVKPEGIYIAFPFDGGKDAKIYAELPGGVFQAGVDQIKASSNDWNTVQSFASVRGDDGQILISSNEIPLMQFGDINTGRYVAGAQPASNNIYSWVMNNYWTTNFNAEQRGEMQWSYSITSDKDNSNIFATRFGWGNKVAMQARILPGGGVSNGDATRSLLSVSGENILVLNITPLPNQPAVIMQLREIAGKSSEVKVASDWLDIISVEEVNALGENIANGSLHIKPFASKFIKVTVNSKI